MRMSLLSAVVVPAFEVPRKHDYTAVLTIDINGIVALPTHNQLLPQHMQQSSMMEKHTTINHNFYSSSIIECGQASMSWGEYFDIDITFMSREESWMKTSKLTGR